MDDQEAQQIIDSQPGNVLEQHTNAMNYIDREIVDAREEFYKTITKLASYYSDYEYVPVQSTILLHHQALHQLGVNNENNEYVNTSVTLRNDLLRYADKDEYAEAAKMLRNDNANIKKAVERSRSLNFYIQQQIQAGRV